MIEGVQHHKGIFSHFSFKDVKDSVCTEYVNFFKRNVEQGSIHNAPRIIQEIAREISLNYGIICVGYFLNYYKDGNDYAPYHRDVYEFNTLTVSFGCSRDFYFKHNQTKSREEYLLEHGDVFIFSKNVNKEYKHSIPQRKRLKDERISILFFYIS